MIEITAAIEHHFGDAVLHRTFRQQLADGLGRVDVRTGVAGLAPVGRRPIVLSFK